MGFKGKTVLITGGASGIGLLSGKCFAKEGANVVLVDCNKEALETAALLGAEYGIRACTVAPGPVMTRPEMAKMKTLTGYPAETQEIVDMFLYLASDKARSITGTAIMIDDECVIFKSIREVKIGGHTKGSGIVLFEMNGMLCVITGDECYKREALEKKLCWDNPNSKAFFEEFSKPEHTVYFCHDK